MVTRGRSTEEKIHEFLTFLRILGSVEMVVTALLYLCGLISMRLEGGWRYVDTPYNIGAFIAVPFLVALSILKAYIFIKGQDVTTTERAKVLIVPPIKISLGLMVTCLLALFAAMLVTGIIGDCRFGSCSVPDNQTADNTVMDVILFLMCLAFIVEVCYVGVVIGFAKVVGIRQSGTHVVPF